MNAFRLTILLAGLLSSSLVNAGPKKKSAAPVSAKATSATVKVAAPSAQEVLSKASAVVAPDTYTASVKMVAKRGGGKSKTYVFNTAKQGSDKLRLTFREPSTLSGHEILRLGDDLWRYVPSLKRAMRIASRDDFEAGDFRNADVLRVDIERDYTIKSMKDSGTTWVLDLRASTKQAGYDRVVYTVNKSDYMPLSQVFYASSGKKLRTLTFSEPKVYGKHKRPSKLKMVNELAKDKYTDMTMLEFDVVDSISSRTFRRESLGR